MTIFCFKRLATYSCKDTDCVPGWRPVPDSRVCSFGHCLTRQVSISAIAPGTSQKWPRGVRPVDDSPIADEAPGFHLTYICMTQGVLSLPNSWNRTGTPIRLSPANLDQEKSPPSRCRPTRSEPDCQFRSQIPSRLIRC